MALQPQDLWPDGLRGERIAAAVKDQEGRNLFAYPELCEALVKGLAIRALWQVKELSKSGKRPILFLDEPYLAGYGSAFTPIQRHEVVATFADRRLMVAHPEITIYRIRGERPER